MAPALTKILRDGHGIHLSSPPAAVRMDSNGIPMRSTGLEPHMRSAEDGDPKKMWLNLSLFPSLDSCLSASPQDVSAIHVLSPRLQASAGQCETLLLPSPTSLLSLLSFNKGLRDSHQVGSVLPGVPDMFLGLIPEHNSQEAYLLHGSAAAPECGPDGSDVHHSPLTLTSVLPLYSLGEVKSDGCVPLFAPPPTLTQEKVAGMGCDPPASLQRCGDRVNFDHLASGAVLEGAVNEQLSRQAGLRSRASRLQKRLQAILGEHTLLHCNQQLDGLEKHCQARDVSLDSLDSLYAGVLPPQTDSKPHFSGLESSTASSSFTELREFSRCSQVVLRGLQEALDSEATASSSSDEESEEYKSQSKTKTSHIVFEVRQTLPVRAKVQEHCHSNYCPTDVSQPHTQKINANSTGSSWERQWLEERAELGSRWSWLQLRLAELEGRIQQLVELHKHIHSTKGGVVLAESQPLTDRQIQQTLLREMAGLSCTGTGSDTEPCSPTRLLHNIERQSAQLSQIVNSLMPPLSVSPLSKQAQTWKDRTTFTSGQKGDNVFGPGSSKRRRMGSRRLFKADVCARTRPLVTYHKPRLFIFNTYHSGSLQKSGQSTLSSSLSSSSCSCCSSCDPVVLCSDPDCSSGCTLSSKSPTSRPHPVLSLSSDTPLSHHLQRALAREKWSQRPLFVNAQSPTPAPYTRHSSTPLHNSHRYKQHAKHHKRKVMGLSPITIAQSQHKRTNRKKRKRRHINRLTEDDENVLYQFCDIEESSDEVQEESYRQVPQKQASQGFVRKRQGESVYNINNIVIPLSLAKVEKLQYKDILTPSWRVVDTQCLIENEADMQDDHGEEQVEDLSHQVFAQRHMALEKREKLRWSSWGKRKYCRHPTRSGSRLSGSGAGMYTSGEESSMEWSGAQLDTDEQPSSEEWLPETPWEPRAFPLDEDEEEALLSDQLEKIPSRRSECKFDSSTPKNSISHLSPARASGAALLSGGKSMSITPNGS